MSTVRDLTPVVALAALNVNAVTVVQNVGYMMMGRRTGTDIQCAGGNTMVRPHDMTVGMAVRVAPMMGVGMTMRNAVAVVHVVGLETPSPAVVVPGVGHRMRRCDRRQSKSE